MSRGTTNGVPNDLATIGRDVGSLLLIEAALITVSVGVALLFGEWNVALAFFLAAGVTAGVGGLANRAFETAPAPRIKHGMVIAASGWLLVAVFGGLPLLFAAWFTGPDAMAAFVPAGIDTSGWTPIPVGDTATLSSLAYFRNPIHAFFESMSGWTGSGLTMAIHEPSLPRAVQWWRSLIQYVGGVGVIVLTVSILARPGSGSYALYRSEAREEKIHPSVVSTVRTVWKLVVGYTLAATLLLFGAIAVSPYGSDLPLWEAGWQALNHAMTGLTTGGFSVTDNSIATYGSPLVETVLLPIMIVGAIAFPIHYVVLSDRNLRELFCDLQTKWLFVILAVGTAALALQNVLTVPVVAADTFVAGPLADLSLPLSGPQLDAIRDSVFQWVSALTCTGFQSAPVGGWLSGGKVLVAGAMTLGGAAGSTVGGIKIIRAYTIARGIRWQFARVFLPSNAVVMNRLGERKLDRDAMEREFSEAAIVTLLWLILLIVASILLVNLVGPDFSYADAVFEVASAQGNVGLSTGITGPTMPTPAEGMLVLNMWVGRLEIIPILVFVRAALYGLNP